MRDLGGPLLLTGVRSAVSEIRVYVTKTKDGGKM